MKTSPTPNSKPLSPRENTRTVRRIAVFALLFIPLFLNVILISYWTFGQPVGPTGDEPHYLIMSKALLGFDLNLKRVYEDEEIVKQASGGSHIAPHVVVGQAGQWYSMHSPGVPFLVPRQKNSWVSSGSGSLPSE
jgi:hypothetical protein